MIIRVVRAYKNVFGFMQNSEPRQPNQCARYLLHISGANWCPQPSSVVSIYINNQLFVPVRSVLPNKKKGSSALLSLPRYEVPGMLFFSDCTEIYLFPTTNQHQFMRQIIFHSVRSNALWGGGGGLRHALTEAGIPRLFFHLIYEDLWTYLAQESISMYPR